MEEKDNTSEIQNMVTAFLCYFPYEKLKSPLYIALLDPPNLLHTHYTQSTPHHFPAHCRNWP